MKFPFSEETITETVLLDLASAYRRQITIVPFNKRQEGLIGADWEWCFYDNSRARFLRMLVQAKALDDRQRAYSHLDRMVGNTGTKQIDLLDRVSRRRGVAAFYTFYNYITDHTRLDLGRCACVVGCASCWGITIASLPRVLAKLPDKTFDGLQPIMKPWACILCPISEDREAASPQNIIEQIASALIALSEIGPGSSSGSAPAPMVERGPPSYFERALTVGRSESPPEETSLVDILVEENPDLDGVTLINTDPFDRREFGGR